MKNFLTLSILGAAIVVAGCASTGGAASPGNGLVSVASPHDAKTTMNRLEAQVKQRNLNVVARIDHAAAAAGIGKNLRATELLIFGNPNAGTPLMECAQGAGIDLPMKALVTVDASGKVWLTYNDPGYLTQRQGVAECPAVENVRRALAGIAQATVAP
jgi:uncharacterized protein (DUF302 family)